MGKLSLALFVALLASLTAIPGRAVDYVPTTITPPAPIAANHISKTRPGDGVGGSPNERAATESTPGRGGIPFSASN